MTLKEYCEKQMAWFASVAMEAGTQKDSEKYNKAKGRYDAYADIILQCPDSVLSKKILDEVW